MRIEAVEEAGEADAERIARFLRRSNRQKMPRLEGATDFAFHIHDGAGEVVGGAMARKLLDWVYLDLLFVPETARGTGIGRRLVERVETRARQLGARGVWLLTFGFQARGFYERLGYELLGTLEGAAPEADEHIMRKFFS